MKFKIFIHLINVAKNITNNSRNDSLKTCITNNTLKMKYRKQCKWQKQSLKLKKRTWTSCLLMSVCEKGKRKPISSIPEWTVKCQVDRELFIIMIISFIIKKFSTDLKFIFIFLAHNIRPENNSRPVADCLTTKFIT